MPKRSPAKTPAAATDVNALLLALLIEAAEREEQSQAGVVQAFGPGGETRMPPRTQDPRT